VVNISVGRYSTEVGYQGWLEPEDRSWIMFVQGDGTPQVFLNRDPLTGAVV
jgi:hypothetical protein